MVQGAGELTETRRPCVQRTVRRIEGSVRIQSRQARAALAISGDNKPAVAHLGDGLGRVVPGSDHNCRAASLGKSRVKLAVIRVSGRVKLS